MSNCFIILAAGESKRFNSNCPKQYQLYKGKTIINHSIDKIVNLGSINKIFLVISKKHKKYINLVNTKNIGVIIGGKTRAESAFIALKYIKKYNFKNVLIHDAARPNFSIRLLNNIILNLKNNDCVIPAIKSCDSVKLIKKNKVTNLKRESVFLTQTPQGFNYRELYKLQKIFDKDITDEATLFISANKKIKFIKGENANKKITIKSDIDISKSTKFGIGFDVHRLVPNRKLYLGGIKIPFHLGTLGHSDGDPVLHAVTDALLGACKMGDIGSKFSDKNDKFKNIRSGVLLVDVIKVIKLNQFFINNIDINIITQRPKIKKYKKKITNHIANLCEISSSQINIKGKTTEKLGLIGKEKAIACEVIASVIKYD
jgi:2-C-methyl-D-erythritol 4-phosphate cytidylyltransferase/2-C-methyl-D-erythritol 2,4-cyclodiphosphate synthase